MLNQRSMICFHLVNMKQLTFNRVHSKPIKLFTREKVIPSLLCDNIIDFTRDSTSGFNRVKNVTPKHWDIQCDTCRIPLDHPLNKNLYELINPLWQEAIDFYGFDIFHIEQYEIKRYRQNDYVTEHQDQFYGTIAGIERKLTLLIQLNEDYTGGDLMVAKMPMSRTVGSLTILPSFYLHEVTPIISGNRFSLNCWGWGKFWK